MVQRHDHLLKDRVLKPYFKNHTWDKFLDFVYQYNSKNFNVFKHMSDEINQNYIMKWSRAT